MKRMILLLVAAMALSFAFAQEKAEKAEKAEKPEKAEKAEKPEKVEKAKIYRGYLVDMMCGKRVAKDEKKAASHTVVCALEESCAESGYGLAFNGTFHKFDANGDKLASEWLTKLQTEGTQKNKLMVEVSGKMEGETMRVASITPVRLADQKGQ